MTDYTASRLGMKNGTGDDDALFLKLFSGEVITNFKKKNVMMSRHTVRTISNGKSAQFPVVGGVSAAYHTPGEEITGGSIKHEEQVILVDDLLVASVFIPFIDEARNHYDVRAMYSEQCADSLSEMADKTLFQVGVNAARASGPLAEIPGGSIVKNTAMATDTTALVTSLKKAAQEFDEKNVPENDRTLFLRPAQYYLLLSDDKLFQSITSPGNGDYANAIVHKSTGFPVVKTNHLPSTNITTAKRAHYKGDFTNTVGLIMHPSAIATVKLLDLRTEGEYQIPRKGTLLTTDYAMGHGFLRPPGAIELSKAA